MEGEEGEGLRLSKRFSDKTGPGEVDYKIKSGTAWSHSYLNQKPWHPLSYPNQRRKWIAEQTHAQHERRAEEVSREYAQEQEFFRQTALVSKKEKEKMEVMKAVSFMYVRPPGYNPESAKAAEIADDSKRHEISSDHTPVGISGERAPEPSAARDHLGEEKKKPRPKDVFGRALPTEEEFEVLKNAPRMETGVPGRVKPFGVEVRNVKCLRCGNYGHQSGDRECPLKDAIMPNEQSRLKRDDPLTAIIAHTDPTEPLKWELKQKPGISPPRGGFEPDDPNQQIVAEDIFDEYGGFLGEDSIPNLLTKFSSKPRRKKTSRKNEEKSSALSSGRKSKYLKENETNSSSDEESKPGSKKQHKMKKTRNRSMFSPSDESDFDAHHRGRRKHSSRNKQRRDDSTYSSKDFDSEEKNDALSRGRKSKHSRENETLSPPANEREPRSEKRDNMKKKRNRSLSSPSRDFGDGQHRRRMKHYSRNKQKGDRSSYSSEDSDSNTRIQSGSRRFKRFSSSKGPESDQRHETKRKHGEYLCSSDDSAAEKHYRKDKERYKHFDSSQEIHDVSHRGNKRRIEVYDSSRTVDRYRGHKSRN